jgi:hypothetical protein
MLSVSAFSRCAGRREIRPLGRSALALVVLLLFPAAVQAQYWNQEAELLLPNEPGGIVRAFTDSLDAALNRHPDVTVRQSQGEDALPYRVLQEALLAEGVDIRSASHLFIRYRFEHRERGLEETIASVTLVYRPRVLDEPDLPLVHLPAAHPLLQDLLGHSGMRHVENLGAITPFRDGLAYPQLSQKEGARMVRFAGQPLRSNYEARNDQLFARLTEFVYNEGEPFHLRLE